MTRKLAVFVEGNTELVFVERLLFELAGYHAINIRSEVQHGGRILQLRSRGHAGGDSPYEALIVNCECDGKVRSYIQERKASLASQGYRLIIGLRDLYPDFSLEELPSATEGANRGLDDFDGFARIVFSVMEVEAWFLKEWTHLSKVDALLDLAFIRHGTGVDLETTPTEEIRHPAGLMHRIYTLVGRQYKKRDRDAQRIVAYLDFARLYTEVRTTTAALDEFFSYLETFLDPHADPNAFV